MSLYLHVQKRKRECEETHQVVSVDDDNEMFGNRMFDDALFGSTIEDLVGGGRGAQLDQLAEGAFSSVLRAALPTHASSMPVPTHASSMPVPTHASSMPVTQGNPTLQPAVSTPNSPGAHNATPPLFDCPVQPATTPENHPPSRVAISEDTVGAAEARILKNMRWRFGSGYP